MFSMVPQDFIMSFSDGEGILPMFFVQLFKFSYNFYFTFV